MKERGAYQSARSFFQAVLLISSFYPLAADGRVFSARGDISRYRELPRTPSYLCVRGGEARIQQPQEDLNPDIKPNAIDADDYLRIEPLDHGNQTSNNMSVAIELPAVKEWNRTLNVIYASTFLTSMGGSLSALAPVQILVPLLSHSKTTALLSAISSLGALVEIIWAGRAGRLLDDVGRKPVFLAILAALSSSMAITAIKPGVVTICLVKLISSLAFGLNLVATQTMISDIVASSSEEDQATSTNRRLSSAFGIQRAVMSLGFLLGVVGAGALTDPQNVRIVYCTSFVIEATAFGLVKWGLSETLDTSLVIPSAKQTNVKWWSSILDCTNLLMRRGHDVRILALILCLSTMPQFMGDIFQVFTQAQWGLSPQSYASLLAMFGSIGILSNILGSRLVQKWGIKRFTGIAILSSTVTSAATAFGGYRGSIAGLLIGFLGPAQSIGIVASLVGKSASSGIPNGKLAGERASLIALLKVLAPIWYSILYIQGQNILGIRTLPFLFDVCIRGVALILSQKYL